LNNSKTNQSINILTFDIEEWFFGRDATRIPVKNWPLLPERVVKSTKIILQLLKKHDQQAVFFILGWIAEQYPDLVKLIASEGHQIGYHSYYHQIPENQDKKTFEEDLVRGLFLLEKIIKQKVIYYRAPQFSLNNNCLWIIPILHKHGIKVSSSSKSGTLLLGTLIPSQPFYFKFNNIKLLELPLNRAHFFGLNFVYSGSGFTRVLPRLITHYFYRNNNYSLIYFHPRDFDTKVPKAKELGFIRNLLNRMGNKTTLNKLDQILENFDFIEPDKIQIQVNKWEIKTHTPEIILKK